MGCGCGNIRGIQTLHSHCPLWDNVSQQRETNNVTTPKFELCHELHASRFKKSKVHFVVKQSSNTQFCVWSLSLHYISGLTKDPSWCVFIQRLLSIDEHDQLLVWLNPGTRHTGILCPVEKVMTSLGWLLCLCSDMFSPSHTATVLWCNVRGGTRALLLRCNPQPIFIFVFYFPCFCCVFGVNTIRVHHVVWGSARSSV